jgi:iron complex outermembrane receptor protein
VQNHTKNSTLDYYNIKVEDRIILGDKVDTSHLVPFLGLKIHSRTSGFDIVMNYGAIGLGTGEIQFNLSGNITLENKRISPVMLIIWSDI